jgi:hypothetical protein
LPSKFPREASEKKENEGRDRQPLCDLDPLRFFARADEVIE